MTVEPALTTRPSIPLSDEQRLALVIQAEVACNYREVDAALFDRTETAYRTARSSDEAWSSFCSSLRPGLEMDVVVALAMDHVWKRDDGSRKIFGRDISTTLNVALELATTEWGAEAITFEIVRPPVRLGDPGESVRVEITDREWRGEGEHVQPEGRLTLVDEARDLLIADDDEEPASSTHSCPQAACLAEALCRALLDMYSPSGEELTS